MKMSTRGDQKLENMENVSLSVSTQAPANLESASTDTTPIPAESLPLSQPTLTP